MKLPDRLHCPRCKGKLSVIMAESLDGTPASSLICTSCSAVVPAVDGFPDFIGEATITDTDPLGLTGDPYPGDEAAAALLERICLAAEDHWPANLGHVIDLACGGGQLARPLALGLNKTTSGLIVADSAIASLRACRDRVVFRSDDPVVFVRLSLHQDAIRDAVADTVTGVDLLHRTGDVRAFLAMVHRILRPGGRAFFVVPNRRYILAFCHAMATALVHRHAREGGWNAECDQALRLIANLRRQLVHQGDLAFLSGLRDKHLFSAEELTDMAREVGFATAETAPLDPDPSGGATTMRLCREAGLADAFAEQIAPLIVSAGGPFFNLLSWADSSAKMLLCLTKGIGPSARTFSARPRPQPIAFANPEAALGGAPPRWSIEAIARDTADGVQVTLDGWCLVNTDVVWVRLWMRDIARDAPVWQPRLDVHGVMNQRGLYQPLNAMCSGVRATVRFDGMHAEDNHCALRIEVVLASGLIVQGARPNILAMDETVTIVQ